MTTDVSNINNLSQPLREIAFQFYSCISGSISAAGVYLCPFLFRIQYICMSGNKRQTGK
jgi:hypothetical protein